MKNLFLFILGLLTVTLFSCEVENIAMEPIAYPTTNSNTTMEDLYFQFSVTDSNGDTILAEQDNAGWEDKAGVCYEAFVGEDLLNSTTNTALSPYRPMEVSLSYDTSALEPTTGAYPIIGALMNVGSSYLTRIRFIDNSGTTWISQPSGMVNTPLNITSVEDLGRKELTYLRKEFVMNVPQPAIEVTDSVNLYRIHANTTWTFNTSHSANVVDTFTVQYVMPFIVE